MDLDVTLFFQLGLLCVLVLVLNRLVFQPLLRVIERREQQTHGVLTEVKHMERLTHADRQAYQTRMEQARREAFATREQLRQQGRDKARTCLAQARAELMQNMQNARAQISTMERDVQQTLTASTQVMAAALVHKLLGRKV